MFQTNDYFDKKNNELIKSTRLIDVVEKKKKTKKTTNYKRKSRNQQIRKTK